MKQGTQLFLGIIFLVVLPGSAFADMMERTTPGDIVFFIVEVFLVLALVVLIVLWIIIHLIGRMPKVSRFLGYTTLAFGCALCLTILLGTIYYHYLGYGAYKKVHSKMIRTRSLLKRIELACESYSVEYGQFPANEEQVIGAFREYDPPGNNENIQQGVLLDDWGTPIECKLEGRKVALRSAGPDRKLYTKDDLTNTDY